MAIDQLFLLTKISSVLHLLHLQYILLETPRQQNAKHSLAHCRAVPIWVMHVLFSYTCRIDFFIDLIYLLTTGSAYSINKFHAADTASRHVFKRNMRFVVVLMMPCHTSSSSLESLLTRKFSARRVQYHLLTLHCYLPYECNMHTKYSDPLVYEIWRMKYSGFTVYAFYLYPSGHDVLQFFTQKLVVPSPWAARELTKQVTFSPYPPMCEYVIVSFC